MKNKTKKIIICLSLLSSFLILGFVVSYAFFNYSKDTNTISYKMGNIYVNLKSASENVNLDYIFPETEIEAEARTDNYIDFSITSYNEDLKDLYYKISLNYGDEVLNKYRIKDKDLKFSLYLMNSDYTKELYTLIADYSFEDISDQTLWVEKIQYNKDVLNYKVNHDIDASQCEYYVNEWRTFDGNLVENLCNNKKAYTVSEYNDFEFNTINYIINVLHDTGINPTNYYPSALINTTNSNRYEVYVDEEGSTTYLDLCLNSLNVTDITTSSYYSDYVAFCKGTGVYPMDNINRSNIISYLNNGGTLTDNVIDSLKDTGYLKESGAVYSANYEKTNSCAALKAFGSPYIKQQEAIIKGWISYSYQMCTENGFYNKDYGIKYGLFNYTFDEILSHQTGSLDGTGIYYLSGWINNNLVTTYTTNERSFETVTKYYRLRMWVDNDVLISDTSSDADYYAYLDSDVANNKYKFSDLYASIKLNIYSSFDEMSNDFALINNAYTMYSTPSTYVGKTHYRYYTTNEGNSNSTYSTVIKLTDPFNLNSYFYTNSSFSGIYPNDVSDANGFHTYANYIDTIRVVQLSDTELQTEINNALKYYDITADNDYFISSNKVYLIVKEMTGSTTESPKYELLFASTKKIWANLDSGNLFDYFYIDTSNSNKMYYFQNVKHIYMDNLYTAFATSLDACFMGLYNLEELDLSNFKTNNAKSMVGMFSGLNNISLDVSNFYTKNVIFMDELFSYSTYTKLTGYQNFDLSNCYSIANMFYYVTDNGSDTLDLSMWDVSNVYLELTNENYNAFVRTNGTGYDPTSTSTDFTYNNKLTIYSQYNYKNYVASPFAYSSYKYYDLSNLKFKSLLDMSYLFYNCKNLLSVNMDGLDTSRVVSTRGMFAFCKELQSIDLNIDLTNNLSFAYMFQNCDVLKSVKISSAINDIKTTYFMFYFCEQLESVELESVNLSKVTNASYMFSSNTNLTSVKLSSMDALTSINYMFQNCSNIESIDLSFIPLTNSISSGNSAFYHCISLNYLYSSHALDFSSIIKTDPFGASTTYTIPLLVRVSSSTYDNTLMKTGTDCYITLTT